MDVFHITVPITIRREQTIKAQSTSVVHKVNSAFVFISNSAAYDYHVIYFLSTLYIL